MRDRSRLAPERLWWLGVALWVAAAALWRPDPPVSYADAPSADPRPGGFAVFHDLVVRECGGARRLLGRPSQIPEAVQVLVLLSPSEPVPETHRRELLDWVASSGATLVVGHPIEGEDGEVLASFAGGEDDAWALSSRRVREAPTSSWLYYSADRAEEPREVAPFGHEVRAVLDAAELGSATILADELGESVVAVDEYGAGRVVQIAESGLLGNASLGWRQTHLFAAALLDEVGRDLEWAFDEAHEGIEAEPSLVRLLGSGRWRPAFLQVLLVGLFLYWWGSARLARPRRAPPLEDVREVATQARDVGDFYMRAGKSRWALARSLEYLEASLKGRGATSAARELAAEAAAEAAEELREGRGGQDRHVHLVRKMALCQRMLAESSKGKRT